LRETSVAGSPLELKNICFLGTSVESGTATAVVVGPGANTLTLSMTNAIGQFSIVSLTVTQSDVALTIGNLSNQDLNQPFIYVSGSIDAEGYTVWVNGVQATPYGDGTWGAVNVPVCEGGTAVIQARAIPSSEGGTGKTVSTMADPGNPSSPQARDAEADPDKPPIVVQVHYDKMLTDSSVSQPPSSVCAGRCPRGHFVGLGHAGTLVVGRLLWAVERRVL